MDFLFCGNESVWACLTRWFGGDNQWCGLLVGLLFCHYLADFCLTTNRMIRAKADASSHLPIVEHAAVHALLMALMLLAFGVPAGGCLMGFCIQLVSHYIIDAAKALLSRHFMVLRDASQKPYWMVYGLDQLLHVLVVVAMTVLFL